MYVKKVTQNSLVGGENRVKKQDEKRSNGKRERERKLKAEAELIGIRVRQCGCRTEL